MVLLLKNGQITNYLNKLPPKGVNKEHLTTTGLEKLIALKASLNLGLSNELKTAFPKVVPVNRPIVPNQNIPDPMWIAGFVSAEGCFLVNIKQSKTISLGYQTTLRFQITQHCRDRLLLTKIISYLDCGHLHEGIGVQFLNIVIHKINDIHNKIIPFFTKHPSPAAVQHVPSVLRRIF
jgi:hypothetical protein